MTFNFYFIAFHDFTWAFFLSQHLYFHIPTYNQMMRFSTCNGGWKSCVRGSVPGRLAGIALAVVGLGQQPQLTVLSLGGGEG